MGYRVEYEPVKKVRGAEKRTSRVAALTAVSLALFGILVCSFWDRGREVLQDLLLPGDGAVTAAAMEDLVRDLQTGLPLGEAVEGFCRTVIGEAELVQN